MWSVPGTALTLLALASTLNIASASSSGTSDDSSDFINGVHVTDAFQHQLRADYAALGWDPSSLAGADAAEPEPAHAHDKHLARRAKAKAKAATKKKKRFVYGGSTKVRGVNLGGWLVTEPWMTPSLYVPTAQKHSNVVDEYTLCKQNGRVWCTSTLTAHYNTFITEADFVAIKAAGLNHVRIPVGYWAFSVTQGEPYVQGSLAFLQKAVLWALKYNLSVMLDLHGLPGSQNGQDNSGQRGNVNFYTKANVARSQAVFKALVAEFGKPAYGGAVTMYEPANEPKDLNNAALAMLKAFYTAAWGVVKTGTGGVAYTALGDAFMGLQSWLTFMPKTAYPNLIWDKHIYTVFDRADYALGDAKRVQAYCGRADELKAMAPRHTVVVGEWTASNNDCGQELKGIKYGPKVTSVIGMNSRYGGDALGWAKVASCTHLSGDASHFSAAYKVTLRKMWEAQVEVYEKYSAGWLMWSWKLEPGSADDWSYQMGLKYGWIPHDPTQRKYPGECK